MKRVMLAVAAVMAGLVGFGETTVVNGIKWNYKIADDHTAIIGKPDHRPTRPLSIPSSLDGLRVTCIGAYAFSDCNRLTAVTIPKGVTSIEEFAFRNCSRLTSVTIPEGVASIANEVFEG